LGERVPIRVDFGDDPRRTLCGGTDSFDVGVGVWAEGVDELDICL
jgi:hypothetical protein